MSINISAIYKMGVAAISILIIQITITKLRKAMATNHKIKLLIVLLPILSLFYVLFVLNNHLLQSKNEMPVPVSRNCNCQSSDIDIRIAFSKDGANSETFICPMTVNNIGRLGNGMGEYATLLALAKSNGHMPYQLESMRNELSKYFNPSMPVVKESVHKKVNWTTQGLHDWMSDEYSNFSCNFITLYGYPCSWTFFHHIRDEIKKEFQFKEELINSVQIHLASIKKADTTTFIGVHVRRGDYINLMKNDYDGVLASSTFFTQAMNYFRNKFKDCLFIVCSDDLNWCQKNINNSLNDVHFCWNGKIMSPGQDMALLTQCNHSIITIGTYSFWSAYLADGEVVYLNNYLRNNSKFRQVFHFDAAYLPEWTPIDADLNSTQWLQ